MQDPRGATCLVPDGPPRGTGVHSQLLEALRVFLEGLRGQNEEERILLGTVACDGDVPELHIAAFDIYKYLIHGNCY